MNNSKAQIRKTILTQRKNLDPKKVTAFSKQILKRLQALPEFKKAKTILLYNPMDNEPDTTPLFKQTTTKARESQLLLRDNTPKATTTILLPEGYHVPTPSPTAPQPLYDLVITPGIAFDIQGNRIGYGKGYFDRLFENLSTDCIKIALAYDFQIIENVPAEEHDKKVDLILTEQRMIIPSRL